MPIAAEKRAAFCSFTFILPVSRAFRRIYTKLHTGVRRYAITAP